MISDFFTATMDVYLNTSSRDESGGLVRGTTIRATGKACRIQDGGAAQRIMSGGRNMQRSLTIITEYADVNNGDEVRVTTDQGTGIVAAVEGVVWRRSIGSMPDFYVLTCREVQN